MGESKSLNTVLREMLPDLLRSFPELDEGLDASLRAIMEDGPTAEDSGEVVKKHCLSAMPSCFFDILYENESLFDGTRRCDFLPGIDFAVLWKENITQNTRRNIWKYLQLILFSTIEGIEDKASFGDAAALFNAISQDEFKSKLEETMESMKSSFLGKDKETSGSGLPDPESIKAHVDKMMGGKLGSLAKEIAEETLQELDADPNCKDPKKMEAVFGNYSRTRPSC